MSEATLTNLLEYLYGTLTPNNMRWLAMHLVEQADAEELKPYTMKDIDAMIDQSERDLAEGNVYSHEDVLKMLDEELNLSSDTKHNLAPAL